MRFVPNQQPVSVCRRTTSSSSLFNWSPRTTTTRSRSRPAGRGHVAKIESEVFDERLCKDRVLYGNGVYFTSETYDSARVIADVRAIHMVKDQHRYPGYQGAGGLPGLDPRARPRASCRRTSSL